MGVCSGKDRALLFYDTAVDTQRYFFYFMCLVSRAKVDLFGGKTPLTWCRACRVCTASACMGRGSAGPSLARDESYSWLGQEDVKFYLVLRISFHDEWPRGVTMLKA